MARLLLLRHGESTWNAEGRWQGWADPPLSDVGEAQSRAAAAWLDGLAFDAVASSDLKRARCTAAILAEALDLQVGPVELDPGLRERDVGRWSSLTADEIEAGWPGCLEAWRSGQLHRPPGGETDEAMTARITASLERLAARPARSILVVTHGGVIRLLDRTMGVGPMHPSNLCGRWLDAGRTGFSPGEEMILPDLDPQETAAIK